MTDPKEQAITAAKLAVVTTCGTPGWAVVQQIGQNLLAEFETAALECEDEGKIIRLQRKAQAARSFFEALLNRVDQMKLMDVGPGPEFSSEESY